MSKSHKTAFIADHGQHNWDLYNAYVNHGLRSRKARDAVRIYSQYQSGLNSKTFTIYTITKGSKIVYVGRTGKRIGNHWAYHKSRARKSADTIPLHIAMMTTTDTATFPEWTIQAYKTTTDIAVAIQLVKLATVAFGTHIHGYNKNNGGGNTSKQFAK